MPTRTDVERLLNSAPQLTQPEDSGTITLDTWTLRPAATPNAEHQQFLQSLLTERPELSASDSLSCTAHEWSRVFQLYKKGPDDRARAYINARCGSILPSVSASVVAGTADSRQSDAALMASFKTGLQQALDGMSAGPHEVGFALVRRDAEVVATLVTAPRRVTLGPLTRVLGKAPSVTVRGRVEEAAPALVALANQGKHGVAECDADPNTHLPEFSFRCPLSDGDDRVWIELLVQREHALLLNPLAALLLYQDEATSLTYREHGDPGAGPQSDDTSSQALLSHLNSAREQAGLRQLAFAEDQSTENAKLAMHFFAGIRNNDVELTNQAALAMLAGFEMPGMIQDGGVLGIHTPGTRNAAAWLAGALERPLGRYVLLDPDMSQVAIARLPATVPGLGIVLTTYRYFEKDAHAKAVGAVLKTFNVQRRAAGSPPAILWDQNERIQAEAAKLASLRSNPNQVAQAVADSFQRATRRQAAVFIVATSSLETLQFPPELLTGSAPTLAIGVVPRRQPGAAWGEYAVVFLFSPGLEQQAPVVANWAPSATF